MNTAVIAAWPSRGRQLFPGVLACAVVAAAATFLSQHYGAPVMLFALLLGLAMNFLSAQGPCAPGPHARRARTPLVWWPIVRGGRRVLAVSGTAALAALAAVGCGGTPVDANEPKGTFNVEILHATFPTKQSIARPVALTITVRNSGSETIAMLRK